MKFSALFTAVLGAASATNALSIPSDIKALSIRSAEFIEAHAPSIPHTLEKRKGGGGRSSGGSSSGGGRSSSSSSSSAARGNSNVGGRTSTGTGVTPRFGGGRYYGGGAVVPYTAGSRTPRGLSPLYLLPVASLAFFPGLWLYGAYVYGYNNPYRFINESAANATFPNGINMTRPVQCLCQQYSVCGCDETDDETYMRELIGTGSYAALNKSLVTVGDVNGTQTILINGTLPNGTTAAGGVDSGASSMSLQYHGWAALGAAVGYAVFLM
ncbi:hypothetical protein H2201_001528 [Coniosporium apollinis]|uniref:DUF7732 domain-containing protein n=2 Tax=Coniosporium TaxID=2810619 RepID=A0ABQ9P1N7_9PEZI|nr:hypothetical protein H2199_001072 [Cladosporium sp. JES 115]KAJ9668480.1 hypothetical protein H2201_001528 [Coniosporium apollinis]